jgi:hypothetical protein
MDTEAMTIRSPSPTGQRRRYAHADGNILIDRCRGAPTSTGSADCVRAILSQRKVSLRAASALHLRITSLAGSLRAIAPVQVETVEC